MGCTDYSTPPREMRAGFRLWFLGDGAGAGLRGWMRGVVGEGEDGLGDLCVGGRGLGVLCVDRTRGRGPGLFERSGWEAGFGVGCGICVGLLVLSLGIPKLAGSLRILHVSGYNVIETPRCCGMLSVTIA